MISVNGVSVQYAHQLILDEISFNINPADRLGLIGPNGAGKSTLLGVLSGQISPERGSITRRPGLTFGFLRQGFADLSLGCLGDLLDEHLNGLISAQSNYEQALELLSRSDGASDAVLIAFETSQITFEDIGGHRAVDELTVLLDRFGLSKRPWSTPLSHLSGGEKTRAGLAAILARRADVLLLDEPTNHLDLDALNWLESFLSSYRGAIVVVSHDRAFLDRIINRIVLLDPSTHRSTSYMGNYTDYLAARTRERAELRASYERQQESIARITGDIRAVASHADKTERATQNDYLRGRSKKVARTAKVRERKLERLLESDELIEKPERQWGLDVAIAPTGASMQDAVVFNRVSFSTIERRVLNEIDLHIRGGERVAITGRNGSGKTTLLKLVADELQPESGSIVRGPGVRIGYYTQEGSNIDLSKSPFEHIRHAAPGDEAEVRTFLHKFLFTDENVNRKSGTLSYGERSRLALALLVRRGANTLLLDEPLNHLDLDSRERFEEALLQFDGTMLIVLHDRYAIERISTRVLLVEGGKVIGD